MPGNIEKGMSAIISSDKKFVPMLEQTIAQDIGVKSGVKTAAKLAKISVNMESKVGTKSAAKLAEIKVQRKSKKGKVRVKGKKKKDCGCDK
jgi:hypothetical protein